MKLQLLGLLETLIILLKSEKDVVIKYDKTANNIKVYTNQVKRII